MGIGMVAGLRGLPRGFRTQLRATELESQTAIKLTHRAQDLKDCETETPVSGRQIRVSTKTHNVQALLCIL